MSKIRHTRPRSHRKPLSDQDEIYRRNLDTLMRQRGRGIGARLAEKLGVHQSQITNARKGYNALSSDRWRQIAEVLNVTVAQLADANGLYMTTDRLGESPTKSHGKTSGTPRVGELAHARARIRQLEDTLRGVVSQGTTILQQLEGVLHAQPTAKADRRKA